MGEFRNFIESAPEIQDGGGELRMKIDGLAHELNMKPDEVFSALKNYLHDNPKVSRRNFLKAFLFGGGVAGAIMALFREYEKMGREDELAAIVKHERESQIVQSHHHVMNHAGRNVHFTFEQGVGNQHNVLVQLDKPTGTTDTAELLNDFQRMLTAKGLKVADGQMIRKGNVVEIRYPVLDMTNFKGFGRL